MVTDAIEATQIQHQLFFEFLFKKYTALIKNPPIKNIEEFIKNFNLFFADLSFLSDVDTNTAYETCLEMFNNYLTQEVDDKTPTLLMAIMQKMYGFKTNYEKPLMDFLEKQKNLINGDYKGYEKNGAALRGQLNEAKNRTTITGLKTSIVRNNNRKAEEEQRISNILNSTASMLQFMLLALMKDPQQHKTLHSMEEKLYEEHVANTVNKKAKEEESIIRVKRKTPANASDDASPSTYTSAEMPGRGGRVGTAVKIPARAFDTTEAKQFLIQTDSKKSGLIGQIAARVWEKHYGKRPVIEGAAKPILPMDRKMQESAIPLEPTPAAVTQVASANIVPSPKPNINRNEPIQRSMFPQQPPRAQAVTPVSIEGYLTTELQQQVVKQAETNQPYNFYNRNRSEALRQKYLELHPGLNVEQVINTFITEIKSILEEKYDEYYEKNPEPQYIGVAAVNASVKSDFISQMIDKHPVIQREIACLKQAFELAQPLQN